VCWRSPATITAAVSTLAHQSEQVFAAALIPIINPATLQDYLDSGLWLCAVSLFGCWIGFKRSQTSRVPLGL